MVNIDVIEKILAKIEKKFGMVQKTETVIINDKKGLLVWDKILWHEITFVESETNHYQSMFQSKKEDEANKEFQRLVEKFGV